MIGGGVTSLLPITQPELAQSPRQWEGRPLTHGTGDIHNRERSNQSATVNQTNVIRVGNSFVFQR